jgi:hypothetical protein
MPERILVSIDLCAQGLCDDKAVAIAVRNVSGRRRWSKLSKWLNFQRSLASVWPARA